MTASASLRFFKASPNDPPSKPTPTKVTFFQRTHPVSNFESSLSSNLGRTAVSHLSSRGCLIHALQNHVQNLRGCAHARCVPNHLTVFGRGIVPSRLSAL